MRLARKWMVGPSVLLALFLCMGCGGGSGSGGGLPALCLTFQAAGTPAASRVTASEGSGSTCDEVEVAVQLTGVDDVFTVSFEVTFDPAVVTYEDFSTADSQLGEDGADVSVLETRGPGSVTLGVTRINTMTGINFVGTDTVVRLNFSPVQDTTPDASSFTFSNTQVFQVFDPDDGPVENFGIQWSGGLLEIG